MKKSFLKILITLSILFGSFTYSNAQNNLCESSFPFCTDTLYNFPAGVNAGTAQSGANYGCLMTQPNPAWYYMEVLDPGPIVIYMSSTPQVDIDFAIWGPYTNQTAPCVAQLTAACSSCPNNTSDPNFYPSGNLIDCSYSTSWNETVHINNAQPGQIYILLICNYSNNPCNINFNQTNTSTPGHGTTNCGILAPPVNNNGPLCEGATLNLTAQTGPAGCTYYWTGPGGFTSTQQNPVIPNVTLAMAGDYFLQVIVGPDTSNAVSTTVVVYPIPTSDFTVSLDSVCVGEQTVLNYTGTATPAATYTWDVDGGTPNSNTGPGPHNISWGGPGLVNVSLVVSENGCTSPPTNMPVYVKPIPTSDFTAVSPVCLFDTSAVTFTGTASANATYAWNFAGGIVVTGTDAGPYEIRWPADGNFSLSLTVTDDGCVSTASYQSVLVNPLPTVIINSDKINGCEPLTVQFNDTINQPPSTYNWVFGDGTTGSSIQNPTHTYANHGTYTVTLTITDSNGCVNHGTKIIDVFALPTADFNFSPTVGTAGLPIDFASSSIGNIGTWSWNFGDGSTESGNFPNITHSYTSTGYFTISLLVETTSGCTDSISKQILIIQIEIPNVFTPNSDGINDKFVIKGIELVDDCQMIIFNRWGNRIYESASYKNDWDGEGAADGTYYFIFTLPQNIMEPVQGTVTIMR